MIGLSHLLVTSIIARSRRGVAVPVDEFTAAHLLLSAALRSKLWRIVLTGHSEFQCERLPERWHVPGTERVYTIARIRIEPSTDDYTAFYDLETTRCA